MKTKGQIGGGRKTLTSHFAPPTLVTRVKMSPSASLSRQVCQGRTCNGRWLFSYLTLTGPLVTMTALWPGGVVAGSDYTDFVGSDYTDHAFSPWPSPSCVQHTGPGIIVYRSWQCSGFCPGRSFLQFLFFGRCLHPLPTHLIYLLSYTTMTHYAFPFLRLQKVY